MPVVLEDIFKCRPFDLTTLLQFPFGEVRGLLDFLFGPICIWEEAFFKPHVYLISHIRCYLPLAGA